MAELLAWKTNYSASQELLFTQQHGHTLGIPPTFLDAEFVIESYKSDEIDEILNYMPYLIEEWKYEAQFYEPSVAKKKT